MDIHDGSDGLAEFSFEYVCKSRESSSSSESSTQDEIDKSSSDIPIKKKYQEPYTQKQIEELTDALIKELTLAREHVETREAMQYVREKDKRKKNTRCVIS